jgi:hypothetical protein
VRSSIREQGGLIYEHTTLAVKFDYRCAKRRALKHSSFRLESGRRVVGGMQRDWVMVMVGFFGKQICSMWNKQENGFRISVGF